MAHTGFVEPQIRFDSMYKTGPQSYWHASGPARRLWENTYDHNSHDSSKEMTKTKYPYYSKWCNVKNATTMKFSELQKATDSPRRKMMVSGSRDRDGSGLPLALSDVEGRTTTCIVMTQPGSSPTGTLDSASVLLFSNIFPAFISFISLIDFGPFAFSALIPKSQSKKWSERRYKLCQDRCQGKRGEKEVWHKVQSQKYCKTETTSGQLHMGQADVSQPPLGLSCKMFCTADKKQLKLNIIKP